MSYIIPNDGTQIVIAETNVAISVAEFFGLWFHRFSRVL